MNEYNEYKCCFCTLQVPAWSQGQLKQTGVSKLLRMPRSELFSNTSCLIRSSCCHQMAEVDIPHTSASLTGRLMLFCFLLLEQQLKDFFSHTPAYLRVLKNPAKPFIAYHGPNGWSAAATCWRPYPTVMRQYPKWYTVILFVIFSPYWRVKLLVSVYC